MSRKVGNDRFASASDFQTSIDAFQTQSAPAQAALKSGGFLATWMGQDGFNDPGIKAQMFDANGRRVGEEFLVNSSTANHQVEPSVAALPSGGFIITWSEETSYPDVFDIRAQIFDSNGVRLGNEILVNTITIGFQTNSVVSPLADGGFVVTWSRASDEGFDDVHGQVFDAQGGKVGAEFLASEARPGDKANGDVIGLSSGDFIVAYLDWAGENDQNGNLSPGVRAQRFDAGGNRIGAAFSLNTTVPGYQMNPALAALPTGGFVAAWSDNGDNFGSQTGRSGIWLQFFSAEGVKIGSEIRVSGLGPMGQDMPAVEVLPGIGLIIAWKDRNTTSENSADHLSGQIVGFDGSLVGSEFAITPSRNSAQSMPDITALSNGSFVVGWADFLAPSYNDENVRTRLFLPVVNGTAGDDIFTGTANADAYDGQAGNDVIRGAMENDLLFGGAGTDTLYGEDGDDDLDGGDDKDVLTGGRGRDEVIGGEGDDIFYIASVDDVVAGERYVGGSGTDIIRYFTFNDRVPTVDFSNVTLDGIEGIDAGGNEARLTAAQFDALTAIEGTFALTTGGAVSLAGVVGAGEYSGSRINGMLVILSDAGNVIDMQGLISEVANAFGGDSSDVIIGNAGVGYLYGNGGDDSLSGGAGVDNILGGLGRDIIDGGDGDDIIQVNVVGEIVTGDIIDGGAGFDTVQINVYGQLPIEGIDLSLADLRSIEAIDARFGTASVGISQLVDLKIGGSFLFVDGGTVDLSGAYSSGFIDFYLSPAGNTIDINQVDTSVGYLQVYGQDGDDVIVGRADSANGLDGASGRDVLTGGSLSDSLQGGAGNDTLVGGAGADRLVGGAGNDGFLVDDPGDVIIEIDGEGDDTVLASVSYTLAAGQAVDALLAFNGLITPDIAQPINLTGNEFRQFIHGNDRDNVLDGGGGGDVLRGFGGNDTLILRGGSGTLEGGDGRDTFVMTLADLDYVALIDFALGERILLTDAVLDGFRFQRAGSELIFPGGPTGARVNLFAGTNPSLIVRAASEGGVELVATGHEAHANDFNADGHGDLLWRNSQSGYFTTWDGSGNARANGFVENSYAGVQSATTQAVATFDWNGDGRSDIVWRDAAGTFSFLTGSAGGFTPDATTAISTIGRDWSVTAVGDFNGDERDDLMFRNISGELTVWQSRVLGFTPNVFVSVVDPSWVVAGVMDFDGDGRDDIVWRNAAAGMFTIWGSSGDAGTTAFTPNFYADASVDGSWSIAALADFNGDGRDDILWRNANGIFTEWQSTGNGFRTNVYADASVSTAWSVAQAADMNGDGMADIVWRNTDVGHLSVWQSTGDAFIANTAYVASVSTDWALIGATGMVPIV